MRAQDRVLRVMTVNTLYRPPLERRWAELAAWIAAEQPHLVCLQEVHEQGDGTTVADWLAAALDGPRHVAFGGGPDAAGRQFGNAILSCWPIEASTTFDLPCGDAHPKVLVHARTGGIDVYSAHLTADPAAAPVRDRQALLVDDAVRASCDPASALPPILAGDFNAGPRASAVAFLRGEVTLEGRGTFFQDAWDVAGDGGPGHTWDHRNPLTPPAYLMDARCDYVFVGVPRVPIGWSTGAREDVAPAGQVVAARLVCHRSVTGVFASDHYGILAEICWPEPPP
jgi:endonuclease/exonuclease/phosphatase family metal-dependent hydrolase